MKNSKEIVKQLEVIRDTYKEDLIFDNEYQEHWNLVNQRINEVIHILWNYDKSASELERELEIEKQFKKEFKENPTQALANLGFRKKEKK